MADFSKEYGFDWHDFSIKEEFDKLEEGYGIGIICEGFGFIGIANFGNDCKVQMPNGEWKKFDFETNKIINE